MSRNCSDGSKNKLSGCVGICRASKLSFDDKAALQSQLAHFLISQGHDATDEDVVRDFLADLGHTDDVVDETCDWLGRVVTSGKATESLDMLHQNMVSGLRIENPIDRPYLPDLIWKKIEGWRLRGILPADVVERLLIGLRNVDVRDWEEEDVKGLVANLIAPAFERCEKEDLKVYERKISGSYYC